MSYEVKQPVRNKVESRDFSDGTTSDNQTWNMHIIVQVMAWKLIWIKISGKKGIKEFLRYRHFNNSYILDHFRIKIVWPIPEYLHS